MKVKGRLISNDNREILQAARTYYVRTDGSDSNDGLSNTSGGAFLTIQKAINVVQGAIDLQALAVTIQIADGTYTEKVTVRGGLIGGMNCSLTIQGNNGTPANVVIDGTNGIAFSSARCPNTVTIKDLKLQAATGTACLYAGMATVNFSNIVFGQSAGAQIQGDFGGQLVCTGNCSISAGAPFCIYGSTLAYIYTAGRTFTWTAGSTAYSSATVSAVRGSIVICSGMSFSGTVTGKRYDVTGNGVVDTGAGGANYIPGNSAGTTGTGGQYL